MAAHYNIASVEKVARKNHTHIHRKNKKRKNVGTDHMAHIDLTALGMKVSSIH